MSKVCEKMVLNRLRWSACSACRHVFTWIQKEIATGLSHISKADAFGKKQRAAILMINIENTFEMLSLIVVLHAILVLESTKKCRDCCKIFLLIALEMRDFIIKKIVHSTNRERYTTEKLSESHTFQ